MKNERLFYFYIEKTIFYAKKNPDDAETDIPQDSLPK